MSEAGGRHTPDRRHRQTPVTPEAPYMMTDKTHRIQAPPVPGGAHTDLRTAAPVAWWPRASTLGTLAWCPLGCGELHQHVVPLGTAGPVVRASHCGRGSYLLTLIDTPVGVPA